MIDFKKYNNQGFGEWQLEELKLATKNKVSDDLIDTYLANVNYDASQMKQVRLGLVQRVDVSLFASEDIPASSMEFIRERLFKQKNEDIEAQEKVDEVSIEKQRLDNKDHAKLHKTLMSIRFCIKLLLIIILLMFLFIIYLYLHTQLKLI